MYRRLAELNAPLGRDGALHLEVGFGDGAFWAAHAAQAEREAGGQVNYLGVEVSGASIVRAERRLRAAGLGKALLVKCSAEFVVGNLVAPGGLERVYVNFPDPWPKARHEEARLLRPDFLNTLAGRLQPGGEVWLTTDHDAYLDFARESAARTGLYDAREAEPPPASLNTKYARKWREFGLPLRHWRFRLLKAVPQAPRVTIQNREEPLPHAVLSGTLPDLARSPLAKTVVRHGPVTAILLEAFSGPGVVCVLGRSEEPDLSQEVLVTARVKPDGRVVAGLEAFGSPLVTPGVKAVVAAVADWLEGQGLRVEKRSY
ncbi:MAG TPA: tRNA (guanine-N7)-methyltransferase [Deinococcales bacterium]|nr:tRNA (guanine-N7)-methyltransferase [Deinococcales bacterium]